MDKLGIHNSRGFDEAAVQSNERRTRANGIPLDLLILKSTGDVNNMYGRHITQLVKWCIDHSIGSTHNGRISSKQKHQVVSTTKYQHHVTCPIDSYTINIKSYTSNSYSSIHANLLFGSVFKSFSSYNWYSSQELPCTVFNLRHPRHFQPNTSRWGPLELYQNASMMQTHSPSRQGHSSPSRNVPSMPPQNRSHPFAFRPVLPGVGNGESQTAYTIFRVNSSDLGTKRRGRNRYVPVVGESLFSRATIPLSA